MADHNYKIESSSATTAGADGGVTTKRNNLIKRFEDKKVDTGVELVKALYTAEYSLHETNSVDEGAQGKYTSQKGWEAVINRATKRLGNLDDYQAQYTKSEFYKLSKEQLAVVTEEKITPAGRDSGERSYLTRDLARLI